MNLANFLVHTEDSAVSFADVKEDGDQEKEHAQLIELKSKIEKLTEQLSAVTDVKLSLQRQIEKIHSKSSDFFKN